MSDEFRPQLCQNQLVHKPLPTVIATVLLFSLGAGGAMAAAYPQSGSVGSEVWSGASAASVVSAASVTHTSEPDDDQFGAPAQLGAPSGAATSNTVAEGQSLAEQDQGSPTDRDQVDPENTAGVPDQETGGSPDQETDGNPAAEGQQKSSSEPEPTPAPESDAMPEQEPGPESEPIITDAAADQNITKDEAATGSQPIESDANAAPEYTDDNLSNARNSEIELNNDLTVKNNSTQDSDLVAFDDNEVIGRVMVVIADDFDDPNTGSPDVEEVSTFIFTGDDFLEIPPEVAVEAEIGDIVVATLDNEGGVVDLDIAPTEVLAAHFEASLAVPVANMSATFTNGLDADVTTGISRSLTAGEHKTIAVLLTPQGVPIPNDAVNNARTLTNNAGAYWKSQSAGKISNFGTVDVISGAGKLTTCATASAEGGYTQAYLDALKVYQPNKGWNDANFRTLPWPANTHIIVFVLGCGRTTSQGFGSLGGTTGAYAQGLYGIGGGGISAIYVKDASASLADPGIQHMAEHEIGHNFGLMHANLLTCTANGPDSVVNGSLRSGCSILAYGDKYDVMGSANTAFVGDLSASAADSIGINVNPIRVTPAINNYEQTYSLSSLSSMAGNRAIVVTDPISKEEYWIELRARGNANLGDKSVTNWWLDYYSAPPFASVEYWFNSGLRITKKIAGQGTVLVLDREYGNNPRAAFGIQRPDQRNSFTSATGGFTVTSNGLQLAGQTASVTITTPKKAVVNPPNTNTASPKPSAPATPAPTATTPPAPTPPAATPSKVPVSSVSAPYRFSPGFQLKSANGQHTLSLQSDGNLVLYSNGKAAWATWTVGKGAQLSFQTDGNLVLYSDGWAVLAATMSQNQGGKTLQIQNDGNLVIYTATGKPIWALWGLQREQTLFKKITASAPSGTCTRTASSVCVGHVFGSGEQLVSGEYRLVMQPDGNWVEYRGAMPVYATGTANQSTRLVFQSDGNLVMYRNSAVHSATMTQGKDGNKLVLQSDGNVVIYAGSTPLWALFGKGGSAQILKPLR